MVKFSPFKFTSIDYPLGIFPKVYLLPFLSAEWPQVAVYGFGAFSPLWLSTIGFGEAGYDELSIVDDMTAYGFSYSL